MTLAASVTLPPALDDQPPRFCFSLHKCGSTMATRLLQDALRAIGQPFVNIPQVFFNQGIPPATWSVDSSLRDLIRPGIVYIGFRALPEFLTPEDIAAGRSVLLVRDPRDALVSAYFSFGPRGSHGLPRNNPEAAAEIAARRSRQAHLGIDAWVLRRAPGVRAAFEAYVPYLGNPNLKLFRYEDVLYRKQEFLQEAFQHLGLPQQSEAFREIAEKHHIVPDTENPRVHVRKATPGDHREKLRNATIRDLGTELAGVLDTYGYPHKCVPVQQHQAGLTGQKPTPAQQD